MSADKKPEETKTALTAFTCGPQCIDDKGHIWDGPIVKLWGGGSVSCSKCGKLAIDVSLWD